MLTKAWISVLLGLLLGSLLFSSGCGWCGNECSNNPYYGASAPMNTGVPNAGGVPAASGTPGWRVPTAIGSAGTAGGATTGGGSAPTTP